MTTPFGDGDAIGRATVLQPDGKIVVVGESYAFTTKKDITVMRYNDDGSRDTSFDGDGIATTDIGSQDNFGDAVALQADGKIVVTGHSWNGSNLDIVVVRYNKDGSLDTGLDGDTTMPNYPGDGTRTTAIGSGKDGGSAAAIHSRVLTKGLPARATTVAGSRAALSGASRLPSASRPLQF